MNATEALVRAPADGYTLMFGTGEMAFLPFLKKTYRYDPLKDFTPVALVTTSWTVFAINPKVPAQTLPELVAYSKAHPKAIRYGSGGVGGALHIAVEMLKLKTGARLRPHPLSRRLAGRDRRDLRPDRDGVDGARLDAHRRQRTASHPGADRPDAASDAAGRADHRRGRPAGGAHGHLVRRGRAAQHAGRRSSRDWSRAIDEVVHEKSFEEKLFKIGCAVAWKPHGGVRGVYRGRNPEMVASHSGHGHPAIDE